MDVLTFGEVMAVFNPDKMGSLNYVHNYQKSIGGAEGNVAIGLTRLGKEVSFYTRVGQDPFGEQIIQLLKGEGVDVSQVNLDEKYPTGVYFKEKRNSEM